MTRAMVKICGLRSGEMVESVGRLPVDYIGLVFAESRRKVTPQEAGGWIRMLRKQADRPLAAGVFVNPSMAELQSVMAEAPLDMIQLHGSESPSFCKTVKEGWPKAEVFKAISIPARSTTVSPETVAEQCAPYLGSIDGLLLDTYDPHVGGGSGKTFQWSVIPFYQAWARAKKLPLFVAGGLHEGNVRELLDQYAPDGVDVSSGVETDGIKDLNKIQGFLERMERK
ncbi:phosphoribosylanthranilate isomerase [Xylanibacillus composti]|uniref:N-(5'-phosphoribosyl)anthranilate isomerase n=1 Tax=Xylanibacillus composti TaxID=1572762 RepID=A0A8J4M0K1_9BACL|nr:phosphoribosylanthranilate isomerase [Xylanibacillus composti]MDT9725471.1 phosphoribosylanthranilate isomerase [Xylanibacillus composti]GIQ67564.1 N-(5'-phosphoribosyl)anthranilate isomerase [Xylanibacillus composti]